MFAGTNTAHPVRMATNRLINGTSLTIEASGAVVCNTSFTNNSDGKLKDNQQIASLSDCLAIFAAVDTKIYTRNDLNGQKRVGFVAGDVAAVLPEYFHHIVGEGEITRGENEEGEPIEETFLTVDYSRLCVILWGVCKTMAKRFDDLESRMS